MSLHEDVSIAVGSHTNELYFLLAFVTDVDKYIITHVEERISNVRDSVPARVRAEARRIFSMGLELLEETDNKKGPVKRKFSISPEAERYMVRLLVTSAGPIRYPMLLYSAALTHAIAAFESFLSDFLIAIFTYRPDTLKSESTATYENILSFGSMKELVRYLATTKAEKILDENIDKVVENLKKEFNFDMSRFRQFKTLREASYRRNVVVHNGGITDEKYCEKIPGSQIGVRLSTDFQYIETLITVIGRFIEYLDNHFSRKMHYRRDLRQNWILNPELASIRVSGFGEMEKEE